MRRWQKRDLSEREEMKMKDEIEEAKKKAKWEAEISGGEQT
jgi:hypothetical protein